MAVGTQQVSDQFRKRRKPGRANARSAAGENGTASRRLGCPPPPRSGFNTLGQYRPLQTALTRYCYQRSHPREISLTTSENMLRSRTHQPGLAEAANVL